MTSVTKKTDIKKFGKENIYVKGSPQQHSILPQSGWNMNISVFLRNHT